MESSQAASAALVIVIIAVLSGVVGAVLVVTFTSWWREPAPDRDDSESILDRTQAGLREAILRLADALAAERAASNEAAQELIRAEFRTHGHLPPHEPTERS